jgi:hypothetical protein
MSDILFVLTLCLFFVCIKFWKNIVAYLLSIPKMCYDSSSNNCCCSAMSHRVPAANLDNDGVDTSCGSECGCDRLSSLDSIGKQFPNFTCRNENAAHFSMGKYSRQYANEDGTKVLQPMMTFGGSGYYLASNDVDEMPCCNPTPLQDIDPDDLA